MFQCYNSGGQSFLGQVGGVRGVSLLWSNLCNTHAVSGAGGMRNGK